MSKLSRDDVLNLARLSRLKLSEEEIERYRTELSSILEYVQMLNTVDVTGLEPTYQVTGLKNVMRADEVKPYQAKPKELLENALAVQDSQFKVRRVL
jgi:aspartyl-tRNA(Asn)/glutamyl-tRNA(Gln) amidotransferase subunit C